MKEEIEFLKFRNSVLLTGIIVIGLGCLIIGMSFGVLIYLTVN